MNEPMKQQERDKKKLTSTITNIVCGVLLVSGILNASIELIGGSFICWFLIPWAQEEK